MKRLVIALTIAATLPFSAQAKASSIALEFCKPVHKLSETVMKGRQKGVSMVDMLEMAGKVESENLKNLAISIVEDAYETNRYVTEEMQRRAIQDFGNENFKLCIDVMKENEK